MSLRELWQKWQTRGLPEHMLTKEEAIERVRAYAHENHLEFREPISVLVVSRQIEPGNREAGYRYVWELILGSTKPMPRVDVDIVEGTVLVWHQPPR